MSNPVSTTEGSPSPSSGGTTQPGGGNPSFFERHRLWLIIGGVVLWLLSFLVNVPLITALLFGLAPSYYFTHKWVKQEDKDSATFVASTSVVLCLFHILAGAYGYQLYGLEHLTFLPDSATKRLWMLLAVVVVGLWPFYRCYSGWNVWPIAHRIGVGIFGVASTLLYWGLFYMDGLTNKNLVFVAFVVTWVVVMGWVLVNFWLEEQDFFPKVYATLRQGSGFGIRRWGEHIGTVASTDGDIPVTRLNPEQAPMVHKFRRAGQFDELAKWAKENGLEQDASWELTPYFLRFGGKRWQIPLGGGFQPCPHQFNLHNLGDEESQGLPDFEEDGWSFNLIPFFDVDKRHQKVTVGRKAEALKSLLISVDRLRLRRPWKFMRAAINWTDRWNTVQDKWSGATGAGRGQDLINDVGKMLSEMGEGIKRAVLEGMAELDDMGLGSTEPILKEVEASDGMVKAQRIVMDAEAQAEAIILTRGAEYKALEGVLDRGGVKDEARRAAIIDHVLPFLLANDHDAATTTAAEFGVSAGLVSEMMRASKRDAN